ncbi:DedA family protein [Streptomyces odonnellii]|uniref:DedA family protein n=1 Tax=Streptomyces odonnellii TaxID=1417980 RepID=UPI000625EB78|nr:VTT domain-containing protein [Streptomyces odonnellii]
MLESLGSLTGSPWIYAVVGVSVLLDVFLPVLPSGVLVVAAATAAAGSTTVAEVTVAEAADRVAQVPREVPADVPSLLILMLCAAGASVLGDLFAFRIARRGGRLGLAIARSRRLATAQERLGSALAGSGGILVVLARFVPAGRSIVSIGAGVAHRKAREFLPWSALAGVAWTGYSAGLGYFGGQWLGASWTGTAVSVLALFAAGALAAYIVKRPDRTPAPAA